MGKKKKSRQPRAKQAQVVLYDPAFAKKQMAKRRPPRRPSGLTRTMAAVQSSAFMGTSQFSPCGPAMAGADVSNAGSLKIKGHGLVGRTDLAGYANGNIGVQNFAGGLGVVGNGAVTGIGTLGRIGPRVLDPRLGAISSVFGYYAIRKLKLSYVPTVSQYNYLTGTTGTFAGSTSLMVLGLTDQADRIVASAPSTVQEIADLPSAVSGPIYQPMELNYSHNGTRVYYTTYTGNTADVNESSQLVLAGLLSSTPLGGATNTIVGSIWAEWEVDFYRPMYPQNELSARPPVGDVKDCKNASAYAVHDSDVKDSKATHQQKDPPLVGAAASVVAKPALVRSTSRESLSDPSALEKPTYFMMVPPTAKKKL
jgi:hypothetical protein